MDQQFNFQTCSDNDLERWYQYHKVAATAAHGELMRRQKEKVADAPGSLGDAVRFLHNAADEINVTQCLKKAALQQFKRAVEVLTTKQQDDATLLYKRFLEDVTRGSSPDMAFLCAVGLGKRRILDLGTRRSELLHYVLSAQNSLKSNYLERLVKDYRLPVLPPIIMPIPLTTVTKRPHDGLAPTSLAPTPKRLRGADQATSQLPNNNAQHRLYGPIEARSALSGPSESVTVDTQEDGQAVAETSDHGSQVSTSRQQTDPQTSLPSSADKASLEKSTSVDGSAPNSLTGMVYELTNDDIRHMLDSGELQRQILLTIPYHGHPPFVTLNMSWQMSLECAWQRYRLM